MMVNTIARPRNTYNLYLSQEPEEANRSNHSFVPERPVLQVYRTSAVANKSPRLRRDVTSPITLTDFDDVLLALERSDSIRRLDRELAEISYSGIMDDDSPSPEDLHDRQWFDITDTVV